MNMDSNFDSRARKIRDFHENHMTNGQQHYFSCQDRNLRIQPQQRAWLQIHLRKARRLLALELTDRFLDLGCGEGYFTLQLAKDAGQTFGLDFTKAALHTLHQQMIPNAHSVYVSVASGQQLPLPQGSIDKALCNHVLEHVLNDDVVVKELHRVLRPGGRLLIGVPLAFTPQIRLLLYLRRLLKPEARRLQLERVEAGKLVPELVGKQGHIRFYSLNAVHSLLERNGFHILKSEGIGLAMRGPLTSIFHRNSLPYKLGTLLAGPFPTLGDGILVLAERK